MKNISVKWPIIIYCSFILLCAISMLYINKKYPLAHHYEADSANIQFIDNNDEIQLGDTNGCASSQTNYNYGSWSEGSWSSYTSKFQSQCSTGSPGSGVTGTSYCEYESYACTNTNECRGKCGASSCYRTRTWTRSVNSAYTSCTSCNPGYRLSGSSCIKCVAGTYSVGGKASTCQTCLAGEYSGPGARECSQCNGTKEYSSAGASKCSICASGVVDSGHTTCTSPKCTVSISSDAKKVSVGSSFTVTITATNCVGENISFEYDNIRRSGNSELPTQIRQNNNGNKFVIKELVLEPIAANKSCTSTGSITVKVGNVSAIKTITTATKWVKTEGGCISKRPYESIRTAEIGGGDGVSTAVNTSMCPNKTPYTVVYDRCNSSPPESTKCYKCVDGSNITFKYATSKQSGCEEYNENECGACFGDNVDITKATSVGWSNQGNDSKNKYMYKNVSKNDCKKITVPDICQNTSVKSGNDNAKAKTCNEETPLEMTETICSSKSKGTSYYQVDITKTYSSQ